MTAGVRPRDALGRPLPWDAEGVEPVPDEAWSPAEAIAAARALLRAGRPFSAHEVLEARWKACPPAERPLWQGLAQLAVAITHAARGNTAGAGRLALRGAAHLDAYAASRGPGYGLDPARLAAAARRVSAAAQLARGDFP